ncbi:energy transducer TonB [Dyadobacter pollutisoli]|uniref:TonB family protein n=1 Tax=Dyadobacter pollutisoli TaxID=2910158 RepID=A0A9E8SLW6_9BACT|nr:TonB family protein [Dyadobacter pollutisoli]WAC13533.1 TonB family protein [Dyadobacter pollutisoli]
MDTLRIFKKNAQCPPGRRSGKVVISFVVNTDGSLANIEVLEWSDKEFVHSAVQVVESMPSWKPALRDQKPVRTKYNLPIVSRP